VEKLKCQRCGYCCITSLIVVISPEYSHLDNIDFENQNKNILMCVDNIDSFCPHLSWDDSIDKASCSVHDKEWFKNTPCYQYCQDGCNIGTYAISRKDVFERYKNLIKEKQR
jgi:hypothetical protein